MSEKDQTRLEKLIDRAHEHPDWAVLEAKEKLFRKASETLDEGKKRPEVFEALRTWKKLLRDLELTEGNSSSFATDDLLNNMASRSK